MKRKVKRKVKQKARKSTSSSANRRISRRVRKAKRKTPRNSRRTPGGLAGYKTVPTRKRKRGGVPTLVCSGGKCRWVYT